MELLIYVFILFILILMEKDSFFVEIINQLARNIIYIINFYLFILNYYLKYFGHINDIKFLKEY